MEIVDAKASPLCNFEVLQFLKEQKTSIERSKKDDKSKRHKNQALATITYETIAWLENSPAELQQEAEIKETIEKLNEAAEEGGYTLKTGEIIQILNHRPATAVEIQLLIEDSEERLTDEQVEDIIRIVKENLPGGEDEEIEDGEDVEGGEEEEGQNQKDEQ